MIVKSKGHCRHTLYLLKAPLVKFPLCYCVTISFVNLLTDTSAVQAVEVVEGEECMFITCYFAPGSTAQGCHVQMKIVASHSSQQLHSWQLNISKDPSILMGTLHLPLEPRTTALDVAVYDLSTSGRVGYLSIPPHVSHSSGLNCESLAI